MWIEDINKQHQITIKWIPLYYSKLEGGLQVMNIHAKNKVYLLEISLIVFIP